MVVFCFVVDRREELDLVQESMREDAGDDAGKSRTVEIKNKTKRLKSYKPGRGERNAV